MNKIKQMLSKISEEIKELIKKFPVSMILIGILTIFICVTIEQDWGRSVEKIIEKILLFGVVWIFGTFFTETFFKSKVAKIISYVITAGISLIFNILLLNDWASDIFIYQTTKFLTTYLIVAVLLSIYKSMKNQDLKFEEYLLRVFRDLFNTTIIYIVLNIGVLLISAVFVELILDGDYGSILERLLVLLFGFYYVPSLIYTICSVNKKEVGSFIKALVLYVMLPLTIIAMGIIYLYIAKILILQDMPENIIFRILAGIFIVAFPIWNMASNFTKDKKILNKIVNLLPCFYAPFLLLEIYSIGIRIIEFGLTPLRYISCVFIVFQIIALFLTFYKKKEKISCIFLVIAVIIVLIFLTPLNYNHVSNLSQQSIIKNVMPEGRKFEELSNEEKIKVNGALEFLQRQIDGEKYIPSYLSEQDKEEIDSFSIYGQIKRRDYIYLQQELEFNIGKYQKVTEIDGRDESLEGIIYLEDINKQFNLKEYVSEIIKQNKLDEKTIDEYFEENNLVSISDKEDLYLSYLSITYYEETEEIEFVRIKGYLFEK